MITKLSLLSIPELESFLLDCMEEKERELKIEVMLPEVRFEREVNKKLGKIHIDGTLNLNKLLEKLQKCFP